MTCTQIVLGTKVLFNIGSAGFALRAALLWVRSTKVLVLWSDDYKYPDDPNFDSTVCLPATIEGKGVELTRTQALQSTVSRRAALAAAASAVLQAIVLVIGMVAPG